MSRTWPCKVFVVAGLLVAFHGVCPGQANVQAPTFPHPQQHRQQGFFDYVLGKVNPDGKNYGDSMQNGRDAVVQHSVDDLYFWSNVVNLLLLTGACGVVLLQWRSADKKEVIAASLITELWNSRVSDRIEIERRPPWTCSRAISCFSEGSKPCRAVSRTSSNDSTRQHFSSIRNAGVMRLSRAHRRFPMSHKTPSDFPRHDEWLSYVHDHIPADEQPYVLACGRTHLFRNFYKVRGRSLPLELENDLRRVQALPKPERMESLEELNKRIFTDITGFLFDQIRPRAVHIGAAELETPRQQIEKLRTYLTEKNRYFAIWTAYKRELRGQAPSAGWDQYVREQLGSDSEDDIAFTYVMAELDRLLLYFHDRNAPLPKYLFGRCWFLHYLRGPERMLQTKALLNMLTSEIGGCASV